MSVGRKASDPDLCSQPTMTRLENHLDKKTLWAIAELFVKDYMSSFDKAPHKIILDVDDTNANTYGTQQLSLFNDYYDEYCYMPMVIFRRDERQAYTSVAQARKAQQVPEHLRHTAQSH